MTMTLLDYAGLKKKGVPYCEFHLRRLEKQKKFPQRVKLNAHRNAWVESEIDKWIAAHVAERDAA